MQNFKDLFKKLTLALAMVVPAMAAEVAPLHFYGVPSTSQQKYWDHLMRFKLWGTNGITSGRMSMPDKSGWTGTATGGFKGGNNKIVLGGPMIIGGDIAMDQDAKLTSGPVRSTGKFTSRERGDYLGTVCAEDGVDEMAKFAIKDTVVTGADARTGICDDSKVAFVKTDLAVPLINPAKAYEGDIYVKGGESDTISVPEGKGVYDLYLNSINIGNEGVLYINMPKGGRLTRIFLDGSITFGTHPSILVQYEGNTVDNKDYTGNLLFYTPNGILFQNTDNVPIQGTFISTQKISIVSNMMFAGQIIANELEIGNEIDGSSFIYVPFDPPIIGLRKVGSDSPDEFPEGRGYVKVPVSLDSIAKVDVRFNYCIEYAPDWWEGNDVAREDDFDMDADHPMPECQSTKDSKGNDSLIVVNDKAVVFIPMNELTPIEDKYNIWINAKFDGKLEEPKESFRLHIFNVQGAVLEGNVRESFFELFVVDSDQEPESNSESSITAKEDTPYDISLDKFPYTSSALVQSGVKIVGLPDKGVLLYKGDTLKSSDFGTKYPSGLFVSVADFANDDLKFLSDKDGYSNVDELGVVLPYTTFKFKVAAEGGIFSSNDYDLTVFVSPDNDAPTAVDMTFTIPENSASTVTSTEKSEPTDVDDTEFTFAFDDTDENYAKVSELYVINADGTISPKEGAELDYESADSVLTIKVIVTDAASTTAGVGKEDATFTATIKLTDVNEDPVVAENQIFKVPENSKGGTEVVRLEIVDGDTVPVNSANNGNAVQATDPDRSTVPNGQLEYAIVETDVPFVVDPNTGIISVKENANIDFETTPNYEVTIVVKDKGNPSKSATTKVKISVSDENEPPHINTDEDEDGDDDSPTCKENCTGHSGNKEDGTVKVHVSENVPTGTVVLEYIVEDVDDKDKDLTTMKVTLVDVNGAKDVDSLFEASVKKVGDDYKVVVTVKDSSKLDFEKIIKTRPDSSFVVTLTVADPDDPKLSDSIKRTIVIDDVNEDPVVAENQEFKVPENSKAGTEVERVGKKTGETNAIQASDPDRSTVPNGQLVYTIVETDVPFVVDSTTGIISVKKDADINFEKTPNYEVTVIVKDKGNPSKSATTKVKISVSDENEGPHIDTDHDDDGKDDSDDPNKKDDDPVKCAENCSGHSGDKEDGSVVVHVKENVPTGTVVFEYYLEDEDEDDKTDMTKLVATLTDNDKTGADSLFDVSIKKVDDGFKVVVTVKDSSKLDFEKIKDTHEVTITVSDPKDPKLSDSIKRTIVIDDVNETPLLTKQNFKFDENNTVGSTVGTIQWDDTDSKTPDFRQDEFKVVGGDTTLFAVSKDGVITTKKVFDAESDPAEYTLIVALTDKNDPTLTVIDTMKIKLDNLVEYADVEITIVDDGKKEYIKPDTVLTNRNDITYCYQINGVDQPCLDTTLTDGVHKIIVKGNDPTMDNPGADTVIIVVSTAAPIVEVVADYNAGVADNIFTVVEEKDKKDTSVYVNSTTNEILVHIVDPSTDPKTDVIDTVKLSLDTVHVPSKEISAVTSISKKKITLNETPSEGTIETPVNGNQIKVSYTEKHTVDGVKVPVTVSYVTDKKGEPVKVAVVNAKGKTEMVEVMTVSYTTVVGKDTVVISYTADANTGAVLNTTPDGALTTESSIKVKNADGSTTKVAVGPFVVSSKAIVNDDGDVIEQSYVLTEDRKIVKDSEGNIGYSVTYTHTNKFGNSASQSIFVVLDQDPPEVKITKIDNQSVEPDKKGVKPVLVVKSNFCEVEWTVDGVPQDTLTIQGLSKGPNFVVRFYRDKAGNEKSDTIKVIMMDAKALALEVEQPVTEINIDRVHKYYAENPPKEGQTFAVSIRSPLSGKEVETKIGGSFKTKDGSGKNPYEGSSSGLHLGPTLAMDIQVPIANGVGGLATMDDIIVKDKETGVEKVAVDGVDAGNSKKVDVEEYVETYCKDDFKKKFHKGGDLSKLNLYDSKIKVQIWIYTTLGNFVDYYSFTQELNDPDYTDESGMLQMFFELKPDKDGEVRAANGTVFATGAYVYKVEAERISKPSCVVPPVKVKGEAAIKEYLKTPIKNTDDLLKSFGYKRPKTNGKKK